MEQSNKPVSFAHCSDSLKQLVEQINAELSRLAAAGIVVPPERVHDTVATGEHGTRYLASFGYVVPQTMEVAP